MLRGPGWLVLVGAFAACGDNIEPPGSWALGVTTFDAVSLGLTMSTARDPFADAIVPTVHLEVPTYDQSGQVVHPDVVREASRLVLVFTPYPFTNGRFENPSIVTSQDGMGFDEPAPGENPLAPAPPIDHNDDPDLHVDPATGEYELLYLETLRPDTQNLVSLRSRDLVTWTRTTAISYDLAAGAPFIVSPAAIVHDGITTLFDVHLAAPHFLERLDPPWNPATAVPVAIELGGVTPWHVDVLACPTGYAMLINGFDTEFTHQDLYLATSPDLVTWTFHPTPLLSHEDPSLGVGSLYRSTGVVAGDRLIVWYSMEY
jgi:hypothetical protein